MEGWIGGRMDRWKDGPVEGWIGGRMDRWKRGLVEGWIREQVGVYIQNVDHTK